MLLWKKVADESATRCCTSATRDWKTVTGRTEHEGLSFLTITLPDFGKSFEKALAIGQVDRDLFSGFHFRAGLPRFLGGFLDLVFDRGSGVLLDVPNIDAILAIRQLTLMFSKILLECSDTRKQKALEGYLECELDVRRHDSLLSDADKADFKRVSSLLFRRLLARVEHDVFYGDLVPKHGPGSTADGLRGNSKFNLRTWTDRLEEYFPYLDFALPSASYYDTLDDVDIHEPGREQPVKVILVPKTLKTPRVIAAEPTAMQYAQQALLRSILGSLERDESLSRLIGIRDQTPNQRMARNSSRDGSLSTIDLREASDRVSNQLVRLMLSDFPHVHGAVDACRSRSADVPGHGVIRLAKFASMGSALTFPCEAMVFLTLVFMGIERELNSPLSDRTVKQFVGEVRIYGDDIIAPVDMVPAILRVFDTFGVVVNTGKSFWTGKFRESCGKEYYDGHDVSIVRVRRVFPAGRQNAPEVISLISLRNQLYHAGYWATCQWLDDEIRRVIKHYPVVLPSSPVLGRHSYLGYDAQKLSVDHHAPVVKGYVVSSRLPSNPLDGPGALLKYFLRSESDDPRLPWLDPLELDKYHLERSGRPQRVDIKLRWASAV